MRTFLTHNIRYTQSLNGLWDVTIEQKDYKLPVPGCWEENPETATYRGVAAYQKTFSVPQDGNLRLVCKGVSHSGTVILDGEKIGFHYNAYTPFAFIVKDVTRGEHTLTIEVDNSFSEGSALHLPNDYYTYGGITRPIGFELVPDVYVKKIHCTPSYTDTWHMKTEVTLENLSNKDIFCDVVISLAGKEKSIRTIAAAEDEITLTWEEAFQNITPWTCETPKLYDVHASLSADGLKDDLYDRTGFRTVSLSGTQILLNGNPVFLKGFNRHEDYAGVGCAVPVSLMVQDLLLMKDMNANAVRTCHYPNDERFLDLCDELGFLVWEENHARGLNLTQMQNPNFRSQLATCNDEMIENHYNHPSIILWGVLNECASETEEGRTIYKENFDQLRAKDRSRPLTFASCKHFCDICFDLPDIVSINMYSRWYDGKDAKGGIEEELNWVNTTEGKGKPFIVSEFGGAAMYGFRDPGKRKWSEEGQADILAECLDVYMHHPKITGVFIWQFADCRVTDEDVWYLSRACMQNNKGIVDRYRRPKMAYQTVKEKFKG